MCQRDEEQLWEDLEEFRKEDGHGYVQLVDEVVRFDACSSCSDGGYAVINGDGLKVCICCGLVIDNDPVYGKPSYKEMSSNYSRVRCSTYRHVFHFNERLAQLGLCGPSIPQREWELIRYTFLAYKNSLPEGYELFPFDKKQVCALLRLVSSCAGDSSIHKKYQERWIDIRYSLLGWRPPPLTQELIRRLVNRFLKVVRHFDYVRHDVNCDGRYRCHAWFRCRHNLPNFNFMLVQFIIDIYENDPQNYEWALEYIWYLPALKTNARKANLVQVWGELQRYTNVPYRDPIGYCPQ